MFRTKTLITIIALMVSVLMPSIIFAESETVTYGTAVVQDDQATNDSIVISVVGISPPPADSPYSAILVSSDGSKSLDLGPMPFFQPVIQGVVQATGNINFTFDSTSDGYDGKNLLAHYSRIKLANGPDGSTAFSDNVPANAAAYVNGIIADLDAINEHLVSAISNASTAQTSSDIEEVKTSIASAVAEASIISGLADGLAAHAAAAAAEDVEDINLAEGAAGVSASAANISNWVNAAKATADADVATQTSASVANIYAGKVFNELSAALDGWDANANGSISASTGEGGSAQARISAQKMATLTLEAKDLPETESVTALGGDESDVGSVLGLGLPSVGEKVLMNLLLVGIILGVMMLGAGSLILVRNRT
ncbi:hypothetical protein OAJ44_01805 [Chloroflexi bacterium]|nr:hypothetical protein [Chloroflexota bacterium]